MHDQTLRMKNTGAHHSRSAPVLPMPQQEQDTKTRDWILAALMVVLVCVAAFWKTVFKGANLSISSHMYLQDTIFNVLLPLKELDCISDSTPYTLLIPYQHLIRTALEVHHKFPLWNDMNACGLPLVGDLMTYMFSPFTLLFAYCNTHTYSLVLCGYVIAGGLGTLLLGKRIGLSPLAACFAALAFAFNPQLAKFAELPNQPFLVPWITLGVLVFGARNFWSSVLVGLICAAAPYVMHAECAFAAVAGAWVFLFIDLVCQREGSFKSKSKAYLTSLLAASISGFAFAAPLLLPFAEFMKNTVCYKMAVDWCKFIPWQALLFDLVHPCCSAGSFFAGIFLIPLMVLGALSKEKLSRCLVIATICAFWVVARIAPFEQISLIRPFNLFMPIYAAPCLLLAMTLLAGKGVSFTKDSNIAQRFAALLTLALCVCAPYIFNAMKPDTASWQFDAIAPQFFAHEANLQSIIAFIAVLALFALPRLTSLISTILPRHPSTSQLVSIAIIALNLWSISGSFKSALPILKAFSYPKTDVISFLQKHDGRVLAVGNHMLLANTNVMYGIKDFRVINPLLPKRYTDFMMQSGGVRQGLSVFVWGAWNLGPELDLASVKYIIVQEPHVDLAPSRFKLLGRFEGQMKVYENLRALPEAFLAFDTIDSSSFENSLKTIRDKNFDAFRQLIVEAPEESENGSSKESTATAVRSFKSGISKERPPEISAISQLNRESPEKVLLKFSCDKPCFAVLNDSYFPGWTATLDGKPTQIYPVNAMFKGVKVQEKGTHELCFEYHSTALDTGLRIMLAGIASLILLGIAQLITLLCMAKKRNEIS